MKTFEKPDDNWVSLGYSTRPPANNYSATRRNYSDHEDEEFKPRWLIQAEEDRQLFQDWLQKRQRPTGLGLVHT